MLNCQRVMLLTMDTQLLSNFIFNKKLFLSSSTYPVLYSELQSCSVHNLSMASAGGTLPFSTQPHLIGDEASPALHSLHYIADDTM